MMVALAGAAVLLLAMKAAAAVVAPIVLSLVVAVGIAPAIGWLERKGLRTSIAFAATVTVTVVLEIAVVILLSASLASFALSLPEYEDEFLPLWESVVATLESAGIDVEALLAFESIDFGRLVEIGLSLLGSITNLFSTLILVTFTAAFMLLEATTISGKTQVSGVPGTTSDRIRTLASQLRAFVKVSALLGAVVAVIQTALLLVLGVPSAILWGLLSFFFSFIPYVGFVLALIPPAFLALLTGGWVTALVVIVGYLLINTASDNFFKPKVMGASTNLSPLAVFVSLIVFGWALGPLGGLLAVPMLLIVKVLLFDAFPEWRYLAAVLGNTPESAQPREEAPQQGDSSQGGGKL
jgi:predicted PurR-regulated permease PerM